MAKYFKNVKSFEDLKKQFRTLLKANHPDNGGDAEKMKEINVEYDALFPIWKNRTEQATGEVINETADSTRKQFYTMNGWEGSNHDWNRSLKEVAQIVRAYVKEKYPTYKFSVRTSYASMCQELHVDLKESPIEIYKTADELDEDDKNEFFRKANRNNYWALSSWTDEEFKAEYNRITAEHGNFYKVLNEVTKSVIEDVNCKNQNKIHRPGRTQQCHLNKKPEPEKLEQKSGYTYKITKGEDTRDGSELWVVRIVENLDKAAYIAENKAMKERGGYYSKFKHGFIFRFDPSEVLTA